MVRQLHGLDNQTLQVRTFFFSVFMRGGAIVYELNPDRSAARNALGQILA